MLEIKVAIFEKVQAGRGKGRSGGDVEQVIRDAAIVSVSPRPKVCCRQLPAASCWELLASTDRSCWELTRIHDLLRLNV